MVNQYGEQWDIIGQHLDKNPKDCKELYVFFAQLDYYFDGIMNEKRGKNGKKRKRRKASLIERKYKCAHPECVRAYGSKAALKYHVKTKHNNEMLPPPGPDPVDMNNPPLMFMRPPHMMFPMPDNGMHIPMPGMPPMNGMNGMNMHFPNPFPDASMAMGENVPMNMQGMENMRMLQPIPPGVKIEDQGHHHMMNPDHNTDSLTDDNTDS
eukprot:TRINITY_DN120_c0_g1_i1.p1 TRINITY_DN120_c0_g1~~TRINITY_DN120_c0_g1_i1.p1  ORF type:complete len:209 (+),score=42.45 TRINITY_DN120_c0_g1_i1:206-832(+)